jgi:DNA invertase Pin-like site-specific DNA recombinase
MSALLVGYARCSTDQQDLTARRDGLFGLGVETDRIYVDHGKQPKLNRRQEAHLVSLVHSGEYSILEVAELFGVGRSTVNRAIERQRVKARAGLAEATSRH